MKDHSHSSVNLQQVILLYFMLFSIGLCKLTWVLSRYLYAQMDLRSVTSRLCEWTASFPYNKLPQLLFFGTSLFCLFVFWGVYFGISLALADKKNNHSMRFPIQWGVITYFLFIVVVNIGLVPISKYIFLDAFIWVVSFCALPIWVYRRNIAYILNRLETKINMNYAEIWGICTVVSAIFLYFFCATIFQPMKISNEFMDIPEQTILAKDTTVDNMQYMNQHRIDGYDRYDPRQIQKDATASDIPSISIPKSPLLISFLNDEKHQLFFYDEASHILSVKGKMRDSDYRVLLDMYHDDAHNENKIKKLFDEANEKHRADKLRVYTTEEQAFMDKNALELNDQVKAGWFFFHHSWVINPVLALSLGADISKQILIYGTGAAIFLKHILNWMGGVSFQNYFKVMFAFYPIYFFVFLSVIYQLFRRADFVCMGALLLSVSTMLLGYQEIIHAPGFNPMRHIFDIVIILLFFRYVQKNNILYLCISLMAGYVALLWSKDFGMFLLLALLVTLCIRNLVLQRRAWVHWLLAFIGFGLAGMLYCLPWHGVNYNTIYMLLGCILPGTSTIRISIVLFGISVGYLLHIQWKKIDSPYYWLAWCLFFYFQFQLIYYIWYPSFGHFLVTTPSLGLLCMTWIYMLRDKKKEYIMGAKIGLVGITLFLYLPIVYLFYKDTAYYNKVFATHVVQNWSFKYGSFQTTMEPQLFSEAVHLIERYEPNTSMYLISKYDTILPVLAHRYNALPVMNTVLDLLSYLDIDRCIQAIATNRPRYVFVDTDILRDLRNDIWLPSSFVSDHIYKESYGRVQAIKNMRKLYEGIQSDYEVLQKGSLITVYKRKYDST